MEVSSRCAHYVKDLRLVIASKTEVLRKVFLLSITASTVP
jgi:hypothetical protein